MNRMKYVLSNPVYSEIIVFLGKQKMSVSGLVEYYKQGVMLGEDIKIKSQPVLREQLYNLKERGYVGLLTKDKEGKKFDKNRKLFYVRWEKIVEEFIKYVLSYSEREVYAVYVNSDYKSLEKNKEKFIKNWYIQESFKSFISDIRNTSFKGVITDLFNDYIEYDIGRGMFEWFIRKLGLKDEKAKGRGKKGYSRFINKILAKKIGKEKAKEFETFEDFVIAIPTSVKIEQYTESKKVGGNAMLYKLVGDKEYRKTMYKFRDQL